MIHLVTRRTIQISRCLASRYATEGVRAATCIQVPKRFMSSDTDFKPSEELAKERYDTRSGEDIERKRARLLYQSRKRGMLENGVILASFADKYLHKLDADLLDQYDRLINLPTNDWDIYYWATKTKPTPIEFETPVMDMLRKHLKSKVSNEDISNDSVLGVSKLDAIVLPAKKGQFKLDIDVDEVSLTNYKEELFDDRVMKYPGNKKIQLMTKWRKRFFERRLRRALSKPTSLKALSDDKETQVYTQGFSDKELKSRIALAKDLIESDYDKNMKHHEFLQTLLSSELTNDPTLYDDEAEAWSDMLWHRNYGTDDDKISPSRNLKCRICQSKLHCCDSGLSGYVPQEIFVSIGTNKKLSDLNKLTCQRCAFSDTYDAKLSHELGPRKYADYLRQVALDKSSIVIVLVDLTDFPGSVWKGLIDLIDGRNKRVIVVANKVDLLPYDGSYLVERVGYAVRKNLDRLRPGRNKFIDSVTVISARTGFGVDRLITRVLNYQEEEPRNVYIIGNNNSGKSTLFSALLQSDLCAIRKGDLVSRVSGYRLPDSDINMLRFPINLVEGWEVESRKRKLEIVERDSKSLERSLVTLSHRRQDAMPHMSTLINRLGYPASDDIKSVIEVSPEAIGEVLPSKPNFSQDHPMANYDDGIPMSASEAKFKDNSFLYHTPSAIHPDQLHNMLTNEERLEVFPNETMIPRRYSLRPMQSIFIAGLARLDLLTARDNVIFTIFASRYLPVHVIQTRKADKFYHQFLGSPYLGVPFGDQARLAHWPELFNSEPDFHIKAVAHHIGAADIVLGSVGWALINMQQDHECVVRAFTPEGRGIFMRDPPLLSRANTGSMGKKIRDTPVFKNPYYETRSRSLESRQ